MLTQLPAILNVTDVAYRMAETASKSFYKLVMPKVEIIILEELKCALQAKHTHLLSYIS